MGKKKRLFGLFAILFVALFSVGCVFATACGKKNKEEEESHTHSYTSTVTKQATCTEKGETTYTCDCGESYTEEIDALGHDYKAVETTAATCTTDGVMTYTCSRCKDTYTEAITKLGHDYTVTFNWSGNDEDGYTADTATYVCKNDASHIGSADAAVTSKTDTAGNTVYTATATIDGEEYTDEKIVYVQGSGDVPGTGVEVSALPLEIDFSDSDTYQMITVAADGTIANDQVIDLADVVTLTTSQGTDSKTGDPKTSMSVGTQQPNSMNTGGGTSNGNGRYFTIDFSGHSEYVGKYVVVEVEMAANGTDGRSLGITSSNAAPATESDGSLSSGTLAIVTSSSTSDKQTLSYYVLIDASTKFYITCDKSVNIYTLSITVSDTEPSTTPDNPDTPETLVVSDVSLNISSAVFVLGDEGYTLTATATVTSGTLTDDDYVWTTGDGVVSVTGSGASVTITPVAAGTTSIVVTVGGQTATCEVNVYATDPALGTWAGEVSFGLGLSSSIVYTVTSLVNIIVDSTGSKNTFTLLIDDLASSNSLASFVIEMIEPMFEDGALAVFEDFDWERNIDGSYTVNDSYDAIEITATINAEGELAVVYNGSFSLDSQSLYIEINTSVGKYNETTSPRVADVVLSDSEISIYENAETTVSSKIYTTLFSDTYNGTYTWSVEGSGVISIEGDANKSEVTIKGVGLGTATLTLTVEGDVKAECSVTVVAGVASVVISGESNYEPNAGEQKSALTAMVTMTSGDAEYKGEYEWTSSDETVATVVSDSTTTEVFGFEIRTIRNTATLTILAEGTTTITVTLEDGSTATYEITVASEETSEESARLTTPAGTVTWEGESWDANEQIALAGPSDMGDYFLYEVSGSASVMTQPQADAYWYGTAQAGDLYVYIEVVVHPGETMTWSNGTYTNPADATEDEIGQFIIGIYNGTQWSFTISYMGENDEEITETYVVSFAALDNLPGKINPEINVANPGTGEEILLGDVEFTTKGDLVFYVDYIEDHTEEYESETLSYSYYVAIKVEGTSSAMTAAQAVAWETTDVAIGTQYIIIAVTIGVGESIDYRSEGLEDKDNTNGDEDLCDIIIIRHEEGEGTFQYKLTDANGVIWMYCLDFVDIVPSELEEGGEKFETSSAEDLARALEIGVTDITITDEVKLTETLEIAEGNVTITLADGATLSSTETGVSVITVDDDASLTITGEGTISYSGEDANNSGANTAAIFSTGTLVIEGGATIESSSVGVRAEGGSVTITGATISSTYFTIWTDAGDVTVTINEGSVVKGEKKGIFLGGDNGNFGITSSEVAEDAKSTLIVNGGTITCENESAICSLGTCNADSVVIVIYGGEITGTTSIPANTVTGAAPAIYMANGTLYVFGGTITGTTAVEVRGGSTTIYDGTLVSTADPLNDEQKAENTAHGAATYGYSLAVFPYGQGVTVTGKSGYADNYVTVLVYGGTFVGAVYGVDYDTYSKNSDSTSYTWVGYTFTITGGTFSVDPSDYLGDDYIAMEKTVEETEETVWVVYALETIVEIDFTDTTLFDADTQSDIIGSDSTIDEEGDPVSTDPVDLTYADGGKTGFTITKSSNGDGKYNGIASQKTGDGVEHQVLNFQGSAKTSQNSLGYYLEAGTYVITVSYFSSTNNTGRYAIVLDASGKEISEDIANTTDENEEEVVVAADEKTNSGGTIVTRTMTIIVTEDQMIYIGSKSSGLYITSVGIYKVADDAEEDTEVEDDLDENDGD